MIRGVLFDMDGVLVNNTQAHVKAFEIFCERYGVEDWQHKLQTAFGMGNDDIMRLILPEEIIREKGMKALGEEKEAIYREVYAPEIRPVRGLVELLEELRRRGIRCAVGSSGCRENVDFVLSNCGITDYFSCIVSGDRVTRCKPDPEIYLLAAEGLHLPSAECLVFEDARVGITAARRAGAGRIELSGYVSIRYRPTERLGLSIGLREEMFGSEWTPIIPAFFTDYLISKRGNLVAKASISRNYRFPSLNDLYFLPGGNPDLKKEHGFTYDAGLSFATGRDGVYTLRGEATWFDSYIDNWIVWLPTAKGFWTPKNVKEVHAYGVEVKAGLDVQLAKDWQLSADGNFSWTPSINHGDPVDWYDKAIGKQLVYIPEFSASVTGHLTYRSWRFTYKWCYYSERFTTSDNDMKTKIGRVKPYFMSDISLEKAFSFRWADLSLKGVINNLFNEEYQSVLSRPMPRLNYEIFLDIRPKWGKRNKKQ